MGAQMSILAAIAEPPARLAGALGSFLLDISGHRDGAAEHFELKLRA